MYIISTLHQEPLIKKRLVCYTSFFILYFHILWTRHGDRTNEKLIEIFIGDFIIKCKLKNIIFHHLITKYCFENIIVVL
jgi:hypothetical protein